MECTEEKMLRQSITELTMLTEDDSDMRYEMVMTNPQAGRRLMSLWTQTCQKRMFLLISEMILVQLCIVIGVLNAFCTVSTQKLRKEYL
mmetsp:Transcript_2498/g.4069  ORF Transcript_2498/g.4069 Transcript_2498/m.4069 type:complete len:89 (-) Transcript_2498:72-338(-)